jgi:hypothetical protein
MDPQYILILRAGAGAALIGALFLGIQRARRRGALRVQLLLAERLHYGLVGAIGGYAALPQQREILIGSTALAAQFLAAWFGLMLGLKLDRRSLRRSAGPHLLLDLAQAAAVAAVVLPLGYAAWRLLPDATVPSEALFVVAGICCALAPGAVRATRRPRRPSAPTSRLPLAACVGVLVAGIGLLPLRGGVFDIRLPFVPEIRAILVQGTVAQMGWSIALGCAAGVVLDLLTRGADRMVLLMLLVAGLALGAGTAASLGLEPTWIGLIAGAWLINSTLRRLEILRSAERFQSTMKIGLLCVGGWLLGNGLATRGVSIPVLCGVFVLVVLLRPAAAWAGRQSVRRLAPAGVFKGMSKERQRLPQVETIGLALAVGLVELVEGPAGTGVLAGVMVGQWALSLTGAHSAWGNDQSRSARQGKDPPAPPAATA